MPDQIGYFASLKNAAGKVFSYLASITLTGTDGKTITVTQDTSLDEAVAMSSKAPKASPTFTGNVTLSGTVTNATLPAFLAEAALQSNVTGDGTDYIPTFTTELYDQGNNFDGASTFTAPVTGKYSFQATLVLTGIDATHNRCYAYFAVNNVSLADKNYSAGDINIGAVQTGGGYQYIMIATNVMMDAGGTCIPHFAVDGGGAGKVVDVVATNSVFGGHLVC